MFSHIPTCFGLKKTWSFKDIDCFLGIFHENYYSRRLCVSYQIWRYLTSSVSGDYVLSTWKTKSSLDDKSWGMISYLRWIIVCKIFFSFDIYRPVWSAITKLYKSLTCNLTLEENLFLSCFPYRTGIRLQVQNNVTVVRYLSLYFWLLFVWKSKMLTWVFL